MKNSIIKYAVICAVHYGTNVVGPPPYYTNEGGDRVVTTNTVTYVTDGSGASPPPNVAYVSAVGRIDTADPVNLT